MAPKDDRLYEKASQFCAGRLKPIIGGTIVTATFDEDEYGDFYPGITIRCTDGKLRDLWFISDEEGYGPGFFSVSDPS